MLYLYCVCYVVFIYRACCVVLSRMLYCTYSYVCICVLWQGRTALADCPEFKLLIKSSIKSIIIVYVIQNKLTHSMYISFLDLFLGGATYPYNYTLFY